MAGYGVHPNGERSQPFTDKYREIIKILLQYSNLSNAEIAAQIGTDISHIRDFREEYKKGLTKIQILYRGSTSIRKIPRTTTSQRR